MERLRANRSDPCRFIGGHDRFAQNLGREKPIDPQEDKADSSYRLTDFMRAGAVRDAENTESCAKSKPNQTGR